MISKYSYYRDLDCLKVALNLSKGYLKDTLNSRLDPSTLELSPAEAVLLEALCLYEESNIDLGYRLNKSPSTIKGQLSGIMIKVGAESRYRLIDLCRFYYIEKEIISVTA